LANETGVHSEELGIRAADFGVHYWTSHHPFIVPEPCTLEPTESFSKDELDEYVAIMAHVAEEARTNPELVKTAPHNSTIHTIDHAPLDDPSRWAMTWRAYRRKWRRAEIARNAAATLQAVREGRAHYGSVEDLQHDLLGEP